MKRDMFARVVLLTACVMSTPVWAQQGRGPGFGRGPGGGRQHDERHAADHEVFQFLLSNHEKIRRTVTERPDGVETLTESDSPEIADKIKEHVMWMEHRITETQPIRMRDPLFAELFRHTSKISMEYEETDKGVRVVETSEDPYVAKLIQEHAKTVSGFVERGFDEAMKNHPVPARKPADASDSKLQYPVIKGYGGIVPLKNVVHLPRAGSRIVVDVTRGADPDEMNNAFDKVARYVNLYAGSSDVGDVRIAVVLHGDATLTALNSDVYAKRFETDGNPNFDCLHRLHEAGVEIYVCGQSLVGKGGRPEDVMVFTDVSWSALTTIVNLESDGYVRIPLGN